jgi:putative ABC transport system permease protein
MTRRTPGERWYRRLLHLYPTDFRDEFGGEMARLYRDRRREESVWALWWSLAIDLFRTAPAEHLSILSRDVRHAWRSLRRTPIVTATAVLTLALGVGANTAVFSVAHAVLWRPLPFVDAGRLVELFEDNPGAGFPMMRASALNYLSWSERSKSFEALAAFGNTAVTLTDDAGAELLNAGLVTASLFDVLRVAPIVGRQLLPADESRGSARVVVLSEPVWRSRFGSNPHVVGRAIALDGERHQIVGVMPRIFREVGRTQASGVVEAQIFLPMPIDRAQENRGNHTLRVVGRLRRDVPIGRARDEMRSIAAVLGQEFRATNEDWSVRIEPVSVTMHDPQVRRSLLLAFGAATMVFLIACANVANLMIARGMRRHGELAVRTALGAGRSRLVRQLLTESVCLAAISGTAGVAVAIIALPLVRNVLPPTLPRLDEMRLDASVLVFGMVVSLVSGIVFGVAPALRATRLDLSQSSMLTGRSTTDPSRARLRQTLVAAQIAIATMLVVGAALLLQAFVRLQHVPLGFEPGDILTARLALSRGSYPDTERTGQFYERLIEALKGSGQLRSVAVATSAPFGPGVRAAFKPVPRAASPAAGATENAAEHIVSADYFRVLEIPLLAGRSFTEQDGTGGPAVAIVSQRVARVAWPGTNPIGQTVERSGRSYEVVGVVGDVRGSDTQGARGGGPDREPRAAVYFSSAQMPQRTMTLLVRPSGEHAAAIGVVRETVRRLDPGLPLRTMRPLRDWLEDSVAPTRLTTTVATIFALSALLLASVGIYGVLAYTVASRTREIGVRVAIGATRRSVIGLVLRDGMTWASSGIVVGLIGAFAAARFIAAILFDVQPRDPLTFAIVAGAMASVALMACAIPAARAVRIDPTIAMRSE